MPVSGEEMINLIRGKMMAGENDRGTTYRTLVRPDLTTAIVIYIRDGRQLRDTGRVRPQGDRLCWTWEEFRDGSELCGRVFRYGDRFWAIADNGEVTSYTLRPASFF